MTTAEQKVRELCDSIMKVNPMQIVIDLVEDLGDELLIDKTEITRDDPASYAYKVSLLREVYRTELVSDLIFLAKLEAALEEWSIDIERVNVALGLPKES